MVRHVDSPLSLPQLADKLGVSPSALSHRFKDETGVSPQRTYRQLRIARSQELLASGASVSEVSDAMGFATPYHFSRLFAQVVGVPPSAFKEQRLSPPLRRAQRRR